MKHFRCIARLDIKSGHVIKGIHLEGLRKVGDPAALSVQYYRDGADELFYVDVVASLYGRNYACEVIEQVSREIFIPLTVGGGVQTVDDIRKILEAGADKVAACSGFINNPGFVNEASRIFGSQCLVGMVEAKRMPDGGWQAFYNSGREASGRDAVGWALELAARGVGELVVTSIDMEGTCKGMDTALTAAISSQVNIPVVAHGGVGHAGHVAEAITRGRADAVAVAHLFHHGKTTPAALKAELAALIHASPSQERFPPSPGGPT